MVVAFEFRPVRSDRNDTVNTIRAILRQNSRRIPVVAEHRRIESGLAQLDFEFIGIHASPAALRDVEPCQPVPPGFRVGNLAGAVVGKRDQHIRFALLRHGVDHADAGSRIPVVGTASAE